MVLRKLGSGALALAGFTHIEPYNSPLAVSEKAIGETPILGFFDRGGKP